MNRGSLGARPSGPGESHQRFGTGGGGGCDCRLVLWWPNPVGEPAYSPATGVAIDGIDQIARTFNTNSGAESTIHTLLMMLTLDANPVLKVKALHQKTVSTNGLNVVEADLGTITKGTVVTPDAWTGESLWSGKYVVLKVKGTVTIRFRHPIRPECVSDREPEHRAGR